MQANNSKVEITPRQLNVLKTIANFEASQCYSATIGEVAEKLGVSRSTAFEHVAALRRKKLLAGSRGKARSLKLTLRANRLLDTAENSGADDIPSYDEATQRPVGVPLAGRVAAGVGIEAVENCQMLSLNSMFGPSDDIFALEIAGDSMIDDGISDGDYVMCKKTSVAENGQLVVAILEDNSATVKRFYDEGSIVRLQPANPDFEPIYSDNCRIDAVVLGLLRRL